jgi:type II secretion system protein N
LCGVKKVSKAILIGLAVLVALGIALAVFVNLYIQSRGSQARIQEELSKLLRVPLKLTNVSVSPFGGLRISGITIPNGGANFLEAASFTANYRLLPLLHGQLVFSDMKLQNPKIVWAQTADGKWRLPEPEQAANVAASEPPAEAVDKSGATPSSKGDGEKAAVQKKSNFALVVERFDVTGGGVELLDRENKHLAVFSEVNMTYTTLTAERVEGTATIGKLVWADSITLENVSTPFKYADGAFELPAITAKLGGGKLEGKYQTHEDHGHSLYKVAVTLTSIDLDQIATTMGIPPGQTTGSLTGQIEVRGDAAQSDRLDGEAHVDLRGGQFHQLDFFQNIGQLLGMGELSDLRIRDGHSDLRLNGNKVLVDKLLLNTADLQLSVHGTAYLDKHLKLNAQLSAEDAVVQRLPELIRDGFGPTEDGRRSIAFLISGNIDKPKTDLLDKFKSRKIENQLGDVLTDIFSQIKKPDDDKARKDEKKPDKERRKKDKDKDKAVTQNAATPTPPPAPPAPAPAPPPEPAAANQ